MPLPLLARLTEGVAISLKSGYEVRQCIGDLAEELVKERPEEPQRRFLEFNTATVEEKLEHNGTARDVRCDCDIIKSVSQQRRLPRTGLPHNPKQASIASDPVPIRVVFQQPLACVLGGVMDIFGSVVHFGIGQRSQAIL
jgi:hypothetical protein